VGELQLDKVAVVAAAREQLLVPTDLEDSPVVEHDDLVGVPDRREPVRDHEDGPALDHPLERRLDLQLGLGVDVRGRLVEDQDTGIAQDRPRQRDPLPLPAR